MERLSDRIINNPTLLKEIDTQTLENEIEIRYRFYERSLMLTQVAVGTTLGGALISGFMGDLPAAVSLVALYTSSLAAGLKLHSRNALPIILIEDQLKLRSPVSV